MMLTTLLLCTASLLAPRNQTEEGKLLTFPGGEGLGTGKHIVLVSGDEEYRSEEALPMLARILSVHHGFRCTVLFSMDPEQGTIDPENQTHIPGLATVDEADMLVLFLRFRELSDADMRHVVDYVGAGKPLLGIRTSTHAFMYTRHPTRADSAAECGQALAG